MVSVDASTQKSAKKKLVIFDAHSGDLNRYKETYATLGYDVTAVLVAATKHANLRNENFKPDSAAIVKAAEGRGKDEEPISPLIREADYIVTTPIEAAIVVKAVTPDCVLADQDMARANQVKKGSKLLETLRSDGFKGAAVLQTGSDMLVHSTRDRVAAAHEPKGFAVVRKQSSRTAEPPAHAVFSGVKIESVAGRPSWREGAWSRRNSGGGSGRSGGRS